MNYADAIPYISYIADDSLSARPYSGEQLPPKTILVGWQCGFEPLFVAVYSYLDVELTCAEAEEIAKDYLAEINWFSDEPVDCDYCIKPET